MTIRLFDRPWNVHHPEASLELPWNILQIGAIVLPLYPVVGVIGLALSLLWGWFRKYKLLLHRRINWGWAVFSVLLVISAAFAWQKQDAFLGLFNFLPFLLLFAAATVIVQTPDQLRRLGANLILVSLPVNLLGFAQLFLKLQTPPIWGQIFGWSIVAGGNPTGRMSSVFIYANIFAGYAVIMFILALGLCLDKYRHLRHHQNKLDPEFWLIIVAIITNFAALILSNSRNAWLIAIAACMAYGFYQGWRIIVGVAAGMASSVILAAYAPSPVAQLFRRFVPSYFWTRLNDQDINRPITLLRKTQWDFTFMMMGGRPWTGWGLRNFTPLYQAVMKTWLGHPHNLYLMIGAEVGIPAALLFIGILLWIFVSSLQTLRIIKYLAPADDLIIFTYVVVFLALVIFNAFDVTLFDLRLNSLFWLLIGALTGNIYRIKAKEKFAKKYV